MHPITQGFMSYSQPVSKLSGFSDRTGEHSCNGRDIGLQIQGDFLPNSAGRNLLHYQVGVFNGEGINQKDKDNKKDIIEDLIKSQDLSEGTKKAILEAADEFEKINNEALKQELKKKRKKLVLD